MNGIYVSEQQRLKNIKSYEARMKVCDILAALLGCLGIACMCSESDVYFKHVSDGVSTLFECLRQNNNDKTQCTVTTKNLPEPPYASGLRAIALLATVLIEFLLIGRYLFYVKYKKSRKEMRTNETLFNSRLKWLLLIEMIYIACCLPPRVNYTVVGKQQGGQLTYTLDTLFTFIMLFRVYLIFKIISVYSSWNNEKAKQICNKNDCEGGPIFALKAEMKDKPYLMLGGSMLICVFILGFAIKLVEQPYESVSLLNWDYFWNGMWCSIVVMTTVGYGDFYPRTHLGRCVIVICAFIGQFFVSLMVVAMSNSAQFSAPEQRAFDKYKKVEEKKSLRNEASRAIGSAIRLYLSIHGKTVKAVNGKHVIVVKKVDGHSLNKRVEMLKKSLLQFRKERKAYVTSQLSTPLDYLTDELQAKMHNKLDKLYYFGVALKKMQARSVNLVNCQQAVGDLADKVYSQICLLHADMSGNGHIKPKIKQTINPKETEKIAIVEDVDAEALLKERKEMLEAQSPVQTENASPNNRKKSLVVGDSPGRKGSMANQPNEATLNSFPSAQQIPSNLELLSPTSPSRIRNEGLIKLSKVRQRAGSLVQNQQARKNSTTGPTSPLIKLNPIDQQSDMPPADSQSPTMYRKERTNNISRSPSPDGRLLEKNPSERSPMERFIAERVRSNSRPQNSNIDDNLVSDHSRAPMQQQNSNYLPGMMTPELMSPELGQMDMQKFMQNDSQKSPVGQRPMQPNLRPNQNYTSPNNQMTNDLNTNKRPSDSFVPYWGNTNSDTRQRSNSNRPSPSTNPYLTPGSTEASPNQRNRSVTNAQISDFNGGGNPNPSYPSNPMQSSKATQPRNEIIMKNFVASNNPLGNLLRAEPLSSNANPSSRIPSYNMSQLQNGEYRNNGGAGIYN